MRILAGAVVLVVSTATTGFAQDIRFKDAVNVDRVLVDVRVLDGHGQAIPGLGPSDFELRVDGKPVELESAQWVPAPPAAAPGAPTDTAAPSAAPSDEAVSANAGPGRLIVFLFQKDLERSRIGGLIRMQERAAELLAGLGQEDRVAVASYDSHLKLWVDFTADRARIRHALRHSILFEREPGPMQSLDVPSLFPSYQVDEARRAGTPEKALLVLAKALHPLPGAKSLVFFSWGLGSLQGQAGFAMPAEYAATRQALLEARTTVFTLDVTNADYHSLEAGLQVVAADTGGFYEKTHLFPGIAMARLQGAMSGYYVLVFARPPGRPRAHSLDVRLRGRHGTVLAKPGYVDAPAPDQP